MPEVTKQRAKEFLMKNDELSSWFLDQYKESEKIDAAGNVVNFLTVKDILSRYQTQPIFLDMKSSDRRKFNEKKLREDIEKNPVLRKYFRQADKVRLASKKGKYNKQQGIIHFELRDEGLDSDDEGNGVGIKRQRVSAFSDQFGD